MTARGRKPGMTADEYREHAKRLAAFHEDLMREENAILAKFTIAEGAKLRRHLDGARSRLFSARLSLESLACRQYGDDAGMHACNVHLIEDEL